MNHHFRSFSEHQQPLQNHQHQQPQQQQQQHPHQHQQLHSSSNSHRTNGNGQPEPPESSSAAGVIRIHSDSQQSLDQLFNLSNSQASIPLRNRNLPASFFNPSIRPADAAESDAGARSFHNRSTSFDHRRQPNSPGAAGPVAPTATDRPRGGNVHMRTQSTIAPMTGASAGTVGWSAAEPGPNGTVNQMSVESAPPVAGGLLAQPAPLPQQRANFHYRNFSSPAFSNNDSPNQYYATPSAGDANNNSSNLISSRIVEETKTSLYLDATMTEPAPGTIYATGASVPNPQAPAPPPATSTPTFQQPYYQYQYPQQAQPHQSASTQNPAASSYFATGADLPLNHEQKFHISHSQPYSIHDHHSSSSSSTNLLGGATISSQAPSSSSSSNENNSTLLCGIPTRAVHSRSSSFDDRPSQQVTHARSQSTIVGMPLASTGFPSPSFADAAMASSPGGNFARPIIMSGVNGTLGGGPTLASPYGQATLSPMSDAPTGPSGPSGWTDMIM